MQMIEKETYWKDFDLLSCEYGDVITRILKEFSKPLTELPSKDSQVLPEIIKKLIRGVYEGPKSWAGLVLGFPGSVRNLTTIKVGTPFLRQILYPIVEEHYKLKYPCIYVIGARFNDVFLRKFAYLRALGANIIVLTHDLWKVWEAAEGNKAQTLPSTQRSIPDSKPNNERELQAILCERMKENGLEIKIKRGIMKLRYLAQQVHTFEGTSDPERLDILGYDERDKALVAFEIKGPKSVKDLELKNLFFQGMEHRNWLEENKMAVKFMFEGPSGRKINTKKRAKLVLGYRGEIPSLFPKFKNRISDKYLKESLYFCKLINSEGNILSSLEAD
jgi:hypothetical protein